MQREHLGTLIILITASRSYHRDLESMFGGCSEYCVDYNIHVLIHFICVHVTKNNNGSVNGFNVKFSYAYHEKIVLWPPGHDSID